MGILLRGLLIDTARDEGEERREKREEREKREKREKRESEIHSREDEI